MADHFGISDNAIYAVSSAAERIIGYFYAGILPIVILTIQFPHDVKSFVETTGGLFAIIISMAVGIGIYTVYFKLFGEMVLYPLQHVIHLGLDLFRGERTSSIGLLRDMGVRFSDLRDAYSAIRNEFFGKEIRIILEVDHGELHVLYLTALITFTAYFVIWITTGAIPSNAYLVISALSSIAALIADTRQHTRECHLMKREQESIEKYLKEHHFLRARRRARLATRG